MLTKTDYVFNYTKKPQKAAVKLRRTPTVLRSHWVSE